MQYSLIKDLQYLKWQQLRSWISFPDCQVVMDKQQTMYQLISKWKWKIRQNYWKIPKSECPDIWIRLPRHKWPKSWSSMEDQVVPLERNLYGQLLAGLVLERRFEKIQLKHGWEKIPNWECLFVHCEKGSFLSMYVDDIKLVGKEQNLDPMWKVLNKEVFVYLVVVDNCRTMFRIANFRGGSKEITIPSKSSYFIIVLWHGCYAKKCVERNCELANKTTQQFYKVSIPCIDDHHFKEEEMKFVGELSQVCSQICSEILILDTILDDLIFYGQWISLHDPSQNGPRLVTNVWIDWFHIFIIHVNIDNIVMWVILSNNADWDCFKTLILREILKIRNPILEDILHFWKSYICSNKLDV